MNQAEAKPRIELEKIEAFVGAAHGSFEAVKNMCESDPGLVNCAWDWGGGDWETALGAASHMGQRETAELLISKGARIDIFSAAMLGKIDVVKSLIAAYPALRNASGPHGIPLIVHAQAGGEHAEEVFNYLSQLTDLV